MPTLTHPLQTLHQLIETNYITWRWWDSRLHPTWYYQVIFSNNDSIPSDMMWTMFAWYEQVLEWVSHPWSLSEVITNTICVKQGCKLSSTLFGLCINEVADCIMHGDYEGINILDTPIHILLYADDIFFITESQWGPEILYIVMNRELGTIVGFLSSKSWFSHDVQWNGNCSEVLGSQDMTLPWPMEWEMW